MSLKAVEMRALQEAQVNQPVCLWRIVEPIYREGREYSAGLAGRMTVVAIAVVTVKTIRLPDIKRSGFVNYGDLLEDLRIDGWRGDPEPLWEIRVLAGDRTDRPRLLAPSGRRSGDYTNVPGRAMRDEPEAVSADDLERLAAQGVAERAELVRRWQERVAEEAKVLFRGEDALRSFGRVLNSLGSDKPKKGRAA